MFFIRVQKFSEYYSKNLDLQDSLTSIFPQIIKSVDKVQQILVKAAEIDDP